MSGFAEGVATGLLVGVSGSFLLLLLVGALTESRPGRATHLSLLRLACVATGVFVIFFLSHILGIPKDALMLFLLLCVIATAKFLGATYGLFASAFAALGLSWILPPDGSLRVSSSSDRLSLALFIFVTIAASRLMGKQADRPSSPAAREAH